MDNRKISICVTSRNEYEKLLNSFSKVLYDGRVAEIVIVDDFSDEEIYYRIEQWYEYDAPKEKVKLAQNTKQIGEKLSEHTAIILADSEWVFLVNSECEIEKEIIDEIFNQEWQERTVDLSSGNLFLNRKKYLDDSPYSARLEKQVEE